MSKYHRFCRIERAVQALALLCVTLAISLNTDGQTLIGQKTPRSEVRNIGAAEVKSVIQGSMVEPRYQPEVYWHDREWRMDLVIPEGTDHVPKVSIRSNSGNVLVVKLPEYYEQIREILRGPGDKAMVLEDNHSAEGDFAIIDLNSGEMIDNIDDSYATTSPDRRFIIFDISQPVVAGTAPDESRYRLYDLLKSPQENTCGHLKNDPKRPDPDMRGIQVYPESKGKITCESVDENDDNSGSSFTWSPDSSKLVFADVKSGVMSLVLVTMPDSKTDLPKTSVYTLKDAQDVCAGATAADGENYCDYHVIQSLGWEGDSVTAVFHHQFGTPLDLQLTIPVSAFVPIGK